MADLVICDTPLIENRRRILFDTPHIERAVGSIASFETEMAAIVKSVKAEFEPVQEGEGDPSPENVRPITGRVSVNIEARGKNLFDKNNYNYIKAYFLPNGKVISNNGHTLVYLPCKPNTTYTASRIRTVSNERFGLAWTNENEVKIGTATYGGKMAANSGTVGDKVWLTVTTGSDATYLLVWAWWSSSVNAAESLQIELGSTATSYEPYSGSTIPISWADEAGMVYKGNAVINRDGSATVTATMASVDAGTLTWGAYNAPYGKCFYGTPPTPKQGWRGLSSDYVQHQIGFTQIENGEFTTGSGAGYAVFVRDDRYTSGTTQEFKAAMQGVQFVYELATPVTYTLTPQEVLRTLRGENNLWSDANGDTTVDYWTHKRNTAYS